MIRLPTTSICVSQTDVSDVLKQLDIYQGLIQQGFRKQQVTSYLRAQQQQSTRLSNDLSSSPCFSGPVPSTLELFSETPAPADNHAQLASIDLLATQSNAPRSSCRQTTPIRASGTRQHVPRQSSLLRHAEAAFSESTSTESDYHSVPTSRVRSVKYRPRSQTYSYEQSVLVGDSSSSGEGDPYRRFDSPGVRNELVEIPSGDSFLSSTKTKHLLSAQAEVFVPSEDYIFSFSGHNFSTDNLPTRAHGSSSPPLLPTISSRPEPTLPPLPVPGRTTPQKQTVESIRIYDDSLPHDNQPQTPADLTRGSFLPGFDAAYTAPPGMARSPIRRFTPSVVDYRNVSGEISPVRYAHLIRERRQREFLRSNHIEGQRLANNPGFDGQIDFATMRRRLSQLWRDKIEADGVGDENFEDAVDGPQAEIRQFSGNRREG